MEGVLAVDCDLRVTFYNDAFARAVHAPTPAPERLPLVQLVRDPALHAFLSRVIANRAPVVVKEIYGALPRLTAEGIAPASITSTPTADRDTAGPRSSMSGTASWSVTSTNCRGADP